MAGRVLPIRERVLTAIQRKLLTIKADTGYAFTMNRVLRTAGDVWEASAPPEAYIYAGRTRTASRTGTEDRYNQVLSFQVRAFAEALEDDVDRSASMLLCDVARCLECINAPLQDPFYSRGHIWLKQQGNIVAYPPPDSGWVCTLSFFEALYWEKASDGRKWSDDDSYIYEEQAPMVVEP